MARPPIPLFIPGEKPPGTYRIVVLGGSAAQGDPEHTFGLARLLAVMLRDKFPEANFDVVNAAMTAINSHVVLPIARDVARHQADLFIVYLGNNEVVGPFGAGTVFAPMSPSLSLIRAGIFLNSTRVGQLLGKLVMVAAKGRSAPTRWGGMEMFLDKQIRADDPGMAKVYNHLQSNLEDILEVAKHAGTKTIVSTVATNLKDSPPFASLHRREMTDSEAQAWRRVYQSGIAFESAGNYPQAIARYLEAARIDDRFAALHYRLGRCYWALGNYDAARRHYIRARDLDTLRFRADTRINSIIRSVAAGKAEDGIYLVDAADIFEAHSPYRTPGNALLHEHVHMTFRGNYILAKAMFHQVADLLPERLRQAASVRPGLTEEACAQRLAYTGYDRYRVGADVLGRFRKAPFTNQIDHQEQARERQQHLEQLRVYTSPDELTQAAARYRHAIEQNAEDPWLRFNYAMLLEAAQAPGEAAEQLRMFLRNLPHHAPAHEQLAKALIMQGAFTEALLHCHAALKLAPDFAAVYYHMAFVHAKQGNFAQSLDAYERLLRLEPENTVNIYNEMGRIQLHQGKLLEAADMFRQAIAFQAESGLSTPIPDVHFNLGHVLKLLGKPEAAANELHQAAEGYRAQLREQPQSGETHAILGRVLAEIGHLPQATEHFRQAVQWQPTDVAKHMHLIQALEAQGKLDEAIDAARDAIRALWKDNQTEAVAGLKRYVTSLEAKKPGGAN
jgi:tetratricopeptide (TPR) repeat protein